MALSSGFTLAQEWSFTDGAGNTITLAGRPERIVAWSSSAAGLMQFGIEPVGIFTDESTSEKGYAEFDLSSIEVVLARPTMNCSPKAPLPSGLQS